MPQHWHCNSLLAIADPAARAVHRLPIGRRLRGAVWFVGGGHLPAGEHPDDHLWRAGGAHIGQ